MRARRVDVGQDPVLLPGRNFSLPACLSVQTAPRWEQASLPTLQTPSKESLPTALIRQAKGREKGNAISVLLIAAFLYHRGHMGPSLSACVCLKQTGFLPISSMHASTWFGAADAGDILSCFCCSATGCSAQLLEFHSCFRGKHCLWVLGDSLFLGLQHVMCAPSCVLNL